MRISNLCFSIAPAPHDKHPSIDVETVQDRPNADQSARVYSELRSPSRARFCCGQDHRFSHTNGHPWTSPAKSSRALCTATPYAGLRLGRVQSDPCKVCFAGNPFDLRSYHPQRAPNSLKPAKPPQHYSWFMRNSSAVNWPTVLSKKAIRSEQRSAWQAASVRKRGCSPVSKHCAEFLER